LWDLTAVSRGNPGVGLVTLRQTFVFRSHGPRTGVDGARPPCRCVRGGGPTARRRQPAPRQGIDPPVGRAANFHRWAENQYDRLPAMATELVHRPAAIYAGGSVRAAKAATFTIRCDRKRQNLQPIRTSRCRAASHQTCARDSACRSSFCERRQRTKADHLSE
jgi:hypothetical protein